MVQDQKTQPQPQEKEERVDVKVGFPISGAEAAMGFLGLGGQAGQDQPTEPMSPDEFVAQGGGGEEAARATEELFINSHPDDVAAIEQKMGPRPQGAQIPESAYQMPPGRSQEPAGQAGMPRFTGGEGGLPSQREAFEYSMKSPPPIQTKQEFEAGQKAPNWWRIMLADFAGGAPGAGREELEKRADKAYQESIQKQMQERSEFERKQGIVGQYAVEPGDEMIKVPLWEGGPEIEMERKNIGQAMPLFTRRAEEHYKKGEMVNLREMMGGNPNVQDIKLPLEEAIEMGKFHMLRVAQGLDKERDWLFVHDRPTWDALQKSDLKRAKELAKIKRESDDTVTQVMPSEGQEAKELYAMMPINEYGGIEQMSPQLSDYIDSISVGSGELSRQHMIDLSKNVHMMNHVKYKSSTGGFSKNKEYYQKELKENGYYFLGERIPANKESAKRTLRVLKTSGKINDVQMQAFMTTHFGEFDRSFEARAPEELAYMTETEGKKPSIALPYDPESVEMETLSEGAISGEVPTASEISAGPGAGPGMRMARQTGGKPTPVVDEGKAKRPQRPQRPLASDEIGENAARKYGASIGLTWEQTQREIAKDRLKIVPGR